ncbi:MAG: glycine cleavage system aminomethyltransferase GcvT, partial [Bacteroidales bacterium]|nr:glycine cleavage system aminomethyltransferase GcvT [Bacteroidales bacterium]
ITKLNAKDFIDKEYMLNLKAEGLKRKLVGFEMIDRGIPRLEFEVCDAEGNNIGIVRSGTFGPSINKAVGTAWVKAEFAKVGTEIYINNRGRKMKAITVKMPFYQGN